MRRFLLALCVLPLALLGCDAPPDTIAGKIQDQVVKICNFKADYAWLTEVVVKADVTVQAVDTFANTICEQVIAARGGALGSGTGAVGLIQQCPYGSIIIDGNTICIEGEDVPPKEE